MAAWMVARLSASSAAPYIPDIPMHPSPRGKTSGPVAPSFTFVRFVIFEPPFDVDPKRVKLMQPTNRMNTEHERELCARPRPEPPARLRGGWRDGQRDGRRQPPLPHPAAGP